MSHHIRARLHERPSGHCDLVSGKCLLFGQLGRCAVRSEQNSNHKIITVYLLEVDAMRNVTKTE